ANPFVGRFYPTRRPPTPAFAIDRNELGFLEWIKRALEIVLAIPSPAIESACRRAYTWHLRRKSVAWQSPEQVSLQADYLKLHTRSHRHSVLERFDQRVEAALGRDDRAAIA